MPASVGSSVATLPADLADLSGSLGEKVRRNPLGSELVTSVSERVRGLRDDGGVTEGDGRSSTAGTEERGFPT